MRPADSQEVPAYGRGEGYCRVMGPGPSFKKNISGVITVPKSRLPLSRLHVLYVHQKDIPPTATDFSPDVSSYLQQSQVGIGSDSIRAREV